VSMTPSDQTGPGCAWTVGLILAGLSAVTLLEAGVFGLGFVAIAVGLIAWKGPRQIAFGGFLMGLGGVLACLWGSVLLRCTDENAATPGSCDAGYLWPWVLGAVAALGLGVALSIIAVRRAR